MVNLGEFDDILVSDKPKPVEMASVKSGERQQSGRRLKLFQDKNYFQWRFDNGRNEYIFYYLIKENVVTRYLVVRRPPGSLRGYVIDYGNMDGKSLSPVLKFITGKRHFDVLSIYGYSLDSKNTRAFRGSGFSSRGIMRLLEKKKRGELPLFVRPVKMECIERDWQFEGLDVRRKDNWRITEICSDGV